MHHLLLPLALLAPATAVALRNNDTLGDEAGHGLRWAKCLADKNPSWLLLAGDSNWRGVYMYIKEQYEGRANLKPIAESCGEGPSHMCKKKETPCDTKPGCDDEWEDRDTLYSVDGKTVRLSLRFSKCGEVLVQRLGAGLAKIEQCDCRAQPDQFMRGWDKPYGMVYTHGLWGMPEEKHVPDSCAEVKANCDVSTPSARHEFLVKELAKFKQDISYFRWATNFHIESHPSIPVAQVEKDNQCQREAVARTPKADRPVMFDVWKETETADGASMKVDRFHFDSDVQHHVASRIFQQMGCPSAGPATTF